MANDKLKAIVQRLHARTLEGAVDWEASAERNAYDAPFASFYVRISESGADYFLSIINSAGQKIETVSDVELDSSGTSAASYYQRMRDIYREARRRALGADKAIDEILETLSKK